MLVSYHYNFLYIHIPKTGGSSVRKVLSNLRWRDPEHWVGWVCGRLSHLSSGRITTKLPRHGKIVGAMEMLPVDFFENAFKFAFVRNPWDLQVSSWHHMRRQRAKMVEAIPDFETFLRWKLRQDEKIPGLPDPAVLRKIPAASIIPQTEYLIDLQGKIVVDFTGRYENLQDDFAHICRTIGIPVRPLPHVRQSKDRGDYRKYYTDATAVLVADCFRADIEAFGYTFD